MYRGLIPCLSILLLSCTIETNTVGYTDYGTTSDSARFYFQKGWSNILDNGQWSESEIAFRKAWRADSSFVIGQSLVGRISRDLAEREAILRSLENRKEDLQSPEAALLNSFISSIHAMNARELSIDPPETSEARWKKTEIAFRNFITVYPNESYIKAEYMEVLHAKYGAQLALDSLDALTTKKQKTLPFFLGYRAILNAELSNFDEAIVDAKSMASTLNNSEIPSQYHTQAKVYFEMDSLDLALELVDKAISLDTNHLTAKGLRQEILEKNAMLNNASLQPYFFALIVNDIDASIDWYSKVLSFEVENRNELESRGLKQANLKRPGAAIELIELSSALSAEKAIPDFNARTRLIGIFKIGFTVEDFDGWIEKTSEIIDDISDNVVTNYDGKRMVIVRDPDGNRVQIFEE